MAAYEHPFDGVIAAFDPSLMIPPLALVGSLLVGALAVAIFRRWQQSEKPLSPSASDQLAEFRSLYEKGAISEEEFKRLRTVLGSEIRQVNNLPAGPPSPAPSPSSPSPQDPVPETPSQPTDPPQSGIQPE